MLRPERGFGEESNRSMLVDVCKAHGLIIANTWFRKPDGQLVTYVAPGVDALPEGDRGWDPGRFAQLDFCVVASRWRGMVVDVRSRVRCGLPADHFPLEVRVMLKLGAAKTRAESKPRWDFAAISDEARIAYDEEVAALAQAVQWEDTVDGAWRVLSEGC